MAQEHATITFTLEDDFSSKMQEIVGKLEDFKRRLDETSKRGTEGFRQTAEGVKGIGDHAAGANAALRSMSTYMKEAFAGLNTQLAGSVKGLSQMEASLVGIGSAVTRFSGSFRGLGAAVGVLGGAAAAAAGSIYLLGRSIAQGFNEAENLRLKLSMSEQSIGHVIRAFERMGKSKDEAVRFLEGWNKALDESFGGTASRIYKGIAEGIQGNVGVQLANVTQQIFEKIRSGAESKEAGIQEWLVRVYLPQPEYVRRRLAQVTGFAKEELDRMAREMGKAAMPVLDPEDIREAKQRLSDAMSDMMEGMQDKWRQGWINMKAEGIDKVTEAIRELDKQLSALAPLLPHLFTEAIKVASSFLWTLNQVVNALRWIRSFSARGLHSGRGAGEESAPEIPPEVQRMPWWRRGLRGAQGAGEEGPGTPQRFGGGADLSGLGINENFKRMTSDPGLIALGARHIEDRRGEGQGQPIFFTQMAETQRDSRDYLREIRDVMVWVRDQQMAAGGGGFLGGAGVPSATGPGQYGGGGGGFGRRSGSAWFGGRAGRGTGGPPEIGQGGPGAGADFYQKALKAVQSSGLVGQVPKDGAQFGITTGSAEEWARFMTATAKAESNFNPRSANTTDPGGSFGVLQYAHNQVPGGNAYDTDASISAFVRDAGSSVRSGGLRGGILGQRFSTIGRHPERTIGNLRNYGDPGAATSSGGPAGQPSPGDLRAPGGGAVQAFIMHHTGGRGNTQGVINTLHQRGLGVQYIMDREGNIHDVSQQFPGHLSHMRTGWGMGAGLSNRNTAGMEVIARSDRDVTPAQVESAKRFFATHYQSTPLLGHGQVNPGHKEADEGMTIVNAVRNMRASASHSQPHGVPYLGGPFMSGRAGQPVPTQQADARGAHGAEVNINVTAPRGHRVTSRATGKGLLRNPKVKTSQSAQMDKESDHRPAAQDESMMGGPG